MERLSQSEIQAKLKYLSGWQLDDNGIKKEWKFDDFVAAMAFINKIADLAEQQNHHPELFNVYNRVSLRFSTHDAGGLTEKDFSIAHAIEKSDALR